MNLKTLFLATSTILAFGITSCNNNPKSTSAETENHEGHNHSAHDGHDHSSHEGHVHDHSHDGHAHAMPGSNSPSFADAKVNAVYQAYIHLKNALVLSDNNEATNSAIKLEEALNAANNTEVATQAKKIKEALELKDKRALLNKLTEQLADYFTTNKPVSGVIYKQICPMANNNNGGYWLSNEKQINNPYYGETMLRCGKNDSEIKM